MGNSSSNRSLKTDDSSNVSNRTIELYYNEEKITKVENHYKIGSDFRWKIENFTDFNGSVDSHRFEIMDDHLKAPLFFKLRISLQNKDGPLVLSIVNDNDRDVRVNGEFYVIDYTGKLVHFRNVLWYWSNDRHDCGISNSNLLDWNHVTSETHSLIQEGKAGNEATIDWSYFSNAKEKFLPGGNLTVGCKFSLSFSVTLRNDLE